MKAKEFITERLKKVKGRWALVSKSNPSKVLQYYKGSGKPSNEWVSKVERRVHAFEDGGVLKKITLLEYNRDVTLTNYKRKIKNKLLYNIPEIAEFISIDYSKVGPEREALPYTVPIFNPPKEWAEHLDHYLNNQPGLWDELFRSMLKKFEDVDPTSNKQYVQWLVRAYTNDIFKKFEDVNSIGSTFLAMFHKLKVHKKLPPEIADINGIKTKSEFNEVYTVVDHEYKHYNIQAPLPKGQLKFKKEFENATMVIPKDEAAACYWGEGTKWCTAVVPGRHPEGHTKNYFNRYDEEPDSGDLYIIVPEQKTGAWPKGTRFQLHFETNEYTNENNENINPIDLIYDLGDDVVKWFNEFHPGWEYDVNWFASDQPAAEAGLHGDENFFGAQYGDNIAPDGGEY